MDSPESGNDLRRHVFDWDDLQIFHAVATTGSMSAAASALGCQQSTVSKRMRQLESRLGSQLIERRAAGIVLTPAGETALDFVLTMQRSAQQLENQVSGRDRAMEGEVVLRAPDGLSTYWLARQMPEFMRVNPAIDVKLVSDQSPTVGDNAAPLSITFVPEKGMDVRASELGCLHYMPMASPDFINTYGAPQSLADVMHLRFLTLEQYDKKLNTWGIQASAADALIKYSFRTDISSVLFETIRYGGGIAMAPTYLAHLYPDELVVLDYEFHESIRFWLKYQPGSHEVGRVKCVGDWIEEVFNRKKNPWFRDEFCHPGEFCDITVIKPQQRG
nr:LysR family transcriptional regulator [Maricaulis parjimensis]